MCREGAAGSSHRTTESGQVVLDRGRHADVLEWLWFLNSHPRLTSQQLQGDKDTFPMAFGLAGKGTQFQQVWGLEFRVMGNCMHCLDSQGCSSIIVVEQLRLLLLGYVLSVQPTRLF